MSDLYERIDSILKERGISGAKMSADLGMSRSFMTELRKGRAKSVKAETAQRIADYFGVTVSFLLGTEEQKETTAKNDVRKTTDEDLMFALWGDSEDIDEDDLEDVRQYAAFVRERKRKNDKAH